MEDFTKTYENNFIELYNVDERKQLYGYINSNDEHCRLLILKLISNEYTGQGIFFIFDDFYYEYIRRLISLYANQQGDCIIRDPGSSNYMKLIYTENDLMLEGLFTMYGLESLSFATSISISCLERLIELLSLALKYDTARLSLNEKYTYYLSTLSFCGEYLLNCDNNKIKFLLFKMFDESVITYLRDEILNDLLRSKYIDDKIYKLSKKLSEQYSKIKNSDLWDLSNVKISRRWKEILLLSDELKEKIAQFEDKRKTKVN